MYQLYEHQQKSINEIFVKFQTNQRVLYQLPTGGGKTIIFTFLSKKWIETTKKKVLVLCHRIELINQTINSLNQLSITCEAVEAKTKLLKHNSDVYVAMVQTAANRLKVNPEFFKDIDLIIIDECHWLIFDKIFNYFPFAKILGCTATPVLTKKITYFKCQHCKTEYDNFIECCNNDTVEWNRPYTMSEIYNDIVVGASISDLINDGKLVTDLNFVIDYVDTSKLKIDNKTNDYSTQSLDETYNSENAIFNCVLNYEQICKDKKTLVFNSTTKSNLLIYQRFKDAGYNVRLFDTVNTNESGNRKELIKWFRDEPDAILCNVGTFTTGFDETTVQAIILNTSTQSLSLFLQMVGRGGRSSNKIYKDNFIVIDGGKNISKHNEWSDNSRDWKRIFFKGLTKPKAKNEPLEITQQCPSCGYIMSKSIDLCPECNFEFLAKEKKEKLESNSIAKPIGKMPLPNGHKIYEYTKRNNQDLSFALRILVNQIFDLFIFYKITKEQYIGNLKDGRLKHKLEQLVTPCYVILVFKTDLESNSNRTKEYLINKIITKLNKHYGE
jgi:superfamily II DNA or RNA helicase